MFSGGENSELLERASSLGVKYYQMSFVDIFGVQRSKLVPASRADEMVGAGGAGFAGFAVHLKMSPTQGDLLAKPDMSTLKVLPWNREVAWLACDLYWCEKEFIASPRNTLRRVLSKLKQNYGLDLKVGIECEFALINRSGDGLADAFDTQKKSCYDAHALMRQYDLITNIVQAIDELGFGPYQCDHEDANGQFEINFDFDHALTTADNIIFFKYLVRSLAEQYGLRATFMPKFSSQLTGNGCHAHLSLHDAESGDNIVSSNEINKNEPSLSAQASQFLAGILDQSPALSAIACPTINSYKRIYASSTISGATWSPNVISWGGNNRTLMCRIPDDKRFEIRLADMACNQYLYPAALCAAGIHGLDNNLSLPLAAPDGCNMYDPHDDQARAIRTIAPTLPRNLRSALDNLDSSIPLRKYLTDDLVDAFLHLQKQHCDDFDSHISPWELEKYLDV
eukprot:CAMPEP_0197319244 /NCGR_PEP_ID=MMETSP0891-20130614/53940_1 /TAXON_ID=44058 ORGANISM="Aureoumbra lagunensis, Strain CCMP1510" /NCGR_SAMPLE_ID=MMETSP0891 /ASSEMBLY_ACC=CAM_ASM_000534 /LENGTH=452 /DNA_ID=CAMNT_0042810073 /DNA_START=104 /DNA_END=1462 /DNA_ORIENTATION=+